MGWIRVKTRVVLFLVEWSYTMRSEAVQRSLYRTSSNTIHTLSISLPLSCRVYARRLKFLLPRQLGSHAGTHPHAHTPARPRALLPIRPPRALTQRTTNIRRNVSCLV